MKTRSDKFGRNGIVPMLALALLLPLAGRANGFGPRTTTQVRIVVDVTAAGRKLTPPTRESPVVYFPVTADIDEREGDPAREQVHRWLAQALAEQGYIPVNPSNDRPSQLIVFEWGEIEAQIEDVDGRIDEDTPILRQKFWNQTDLLDLVAGQRGNGPLPWWKRADLLREGVAGRHFVRLVAFDYAAAKKGKKTMLWHARVSTHSDGVKLREVLATLIKAGAPHFGRQTRDPILQHLPYVPEGQVELGDSTVKEYLPGTSGSEK